MDSIFAPSESSSLPPSVFKAKVMLLGDHAVGKSAIANRYIRNYFDEARHATVGIDFLSKNLRTYGGQQVRLQLWDTAGQERFRSLIPGYLKNCMGAVIVFDLSSKLMRNFQDASSFDNCGDWLNMVRDVRGTKTLLFLVGNKSDLKTSCVIDTQQVIKWADEHDVRYFEISAKTGDNIDVMFQGICQDLLEFQSQTAKTKPTSSTHLTQKPDTKPKTKCCKQM